MSSDGRRCEVTFQPGKPAGGRPQRSHVAAGESLLAAARAAGVRLHSECGGDGLCGKCKVIVRRGSVSHP
ncbi:MAG TPA: 2Fe-2S iron-sulfur cluster-binding protein, partial [Planctomycetota bacterium]|nr:2Fe-2S iron-sulfur cluster-binding protein [Planctomycetota bacterium]